MKFSEQFIFKISTDILSLKNTTCNFFIQISFQPKMDSRYPRLLSQNMELQLLSYNTGISKTKKLVKVSRITPFYV